MLAGRLSDRILFEAISIEGTGEDRARVATEDFRRPCEPQRQTETSCRFIVRFDSRTRDVTPASHRIVWEGRRWTITGAIHDLRKTQVTIDCDGSDLITTTDLDSEHAEFLDAVPVLRPEDE